MRSKETAKEFLQRHGKDYSDAGQFNVFKIEEYSDSISIPFNRRDFYKMTLLVKGEGVLSYSDKVVHVKDHTMVFTNPMIPYTYESISGKEKGYFCLFSDEFINHQLKADSLSASPLFKVRGNHVLFPDQRSMEIIRYVFEQMLAEMKSSYTNKYDLLRSYVQIIIHESLKIDPPLDAHQTGASAARLSDLFLQLLERQFPIASPRHVIGFKNANEFADQLSVHTNHLNRVLKENTGMTTTEHLSQRLIKEAKALLLHTNWDIAEIGYCLGFDHASNFYIFFKKHTGETASRFRKQHVAHS